MEERRPAVRPRRYDKQSMPLAILRAASVPVLASFVFTSGCVASRITPDGDTGSESTSAGGNSTSSAAGGTGGSAGDSSVDTGGATSMGAGGHTSTGTGGGSGGFEAAFMLGADISSVPESNVSFIDTDGETKSIFELLKNHGFNTIRLRTFVDPSAPYGYASSANGCAGLSEPFGDRDHVVAFAKQVKDAGMGFLLNFHYSDVWADPGNQIIPEAWRDVDTID